MRRRKGIFFVDALVGFGLLTAVALVLVAGRSAAARAVRATEDRRAAVRMAEAYLADEAAAVASTQPAAVVTKLPTAAPAGWEWVSVRIEIDGHAGELVGLTRGRP